MGEGNVTEINVREVVLDILLKSRTAFRIVCGVIPCSSL